MITTLEEKTQASVRTICRTLNVPRSSFYHAARPTRRQLEDNQLSNIIKEIFWAHKCRYGSRRISRELVDHGFECSPDRTLRLMRQGALRAITSRRYLPQTSDGKASCPSPNLLVDKPLPTQPNAVWSGDITYIPCADGKWLYLAVVIDLFSRRIIGWHIATHMRADLVTAALDQALQNRGQHHHNLIFHSDRGSQYSAKAFRTKLKAAGITQSMSARANPYHNAWTESFIGTLKTELIQDADFHNLQQARLALFEYFEGYYNTKRKHSSLKYLTPNQFEKAQQAKDHHDSLVSLLN